jgi:hypothetical protein
VRIGCEAVKPLDGNAVGFEPYSQAQHRGVDMSGSDDDLFDEEGHGEAEEFDRLTDRLFEHISKFADDEDIPDEWLPLMLLRLSLTTRMMAYATSVAKPSAGGLKLDLDRFRQDAEAFIREMKKDAERFIAEAKEAIATQGQEEDEA